MTGPEHYREAERLLEYGPSDELEPERVARDIAEAQVHATLAQVAATADLFALYGRSGDEAKEAWRKALAGTAEEERAK